MFLRALPLVACIAALVVVPNDASAYASEDDSSDGGDDESGDDTGDESDGGTDDEPIAGPPGTENALPPTFGQYDNEGCRVAAAPSPANAWWLGLLLLGCAARRRDR